MRISISRIAFPIIVYLGGTLFSWGLDDAGSFLNNAARMGFIIESLFANWIEMFSTSSTNPRRITKLGEAPRQSLYSTLMGARFIAGILFFPFADRRSLGTFADNIALRYVGLLLYIVGYSISNWAIIKLGQNWSGTIVIQEGHRLITDGPYTYLRHPHYFGMVLAGFGTALLFRSWIGILPVALLDPAYFNMRIRIEEKMLQEEFGKEWEEYTRRTWRLVPLLY
jgi:protein-S-isoprenylcysteine O-methyltransferase Ste14